MLETGKIKLFADYKMIHNILCPTLDKTTISCIMSPARKVTSHIGGNHYEDYQEKWCRSPIRYF